MQITIDHADLIEHSNGGRLWMLGLLVENGEQSKRILHAMPEETLENIAVEYGLDPDDFDTLLDVVLYLPYVADPITHDHPKAPHLVGDVAEAREHLLAQVQAAKGAGRLKGQRGRSVIGAAGPRMASMVVLDSGAEDPIEVLRREIPRSAEHIEIKREAYQRTRQRVGQERAAKAVAKQAASATGRAREAPKEMRARLVAEGVLQPDEIKQKKDEADA